MTAAEARAVRAEIRKNTGWVTAFGVILVVLGVLSIVIPVVAGIATAGAVGVILLVGSAAEVLYAMKAATWRVGLPSLLLGVLMFLCGVLMIVRPVAALAFLTWLLAVWFFARGFITFYVAWRLRPIQGWSWTLFSGILSILLGILVAVQWPLSAEWAIGTLVGIALLFGGWQLVALATAARDVAKA